MELLVLLLKGFIITLSVNGLQILIKRHNHIGYKEKASPPIRNPANWRHGHLKAKGRYTPETNKIKAKGWRNYLIQAPTEKGVAVLIAK